LVETASVPEPLPEAALNAPEKVIKGTEFEILPEAVPGIGGYVYLYRSGKDKHIGYGRVLENSDGYKPIRIRMPALAGDYELRWTMKDKRTIATRAIVSTEPEVKIIVPERATVGTEIEINFDAPLGLGGYVYLYPAGRDKSIAHAYVVEGESDNYKPSVIRLPAAAGDYVLKWISPDKQVYAEAEFAAEEAKVSITAPAEVPAGTEFEVSLDAPRGLSGYIYLYPAGKKKHIAHAYVREGKTTVYDKTRLRLPAVPGKFDVRWISARKEVLASTSLTSVAAEMALNAPDSAQAGTEIAVNMEGPAGLGGYIYLYPEGRNKHITYAYVRGGKVEDYAPSRIRLPATSGNYVLRWISPKKELLAERAL
jgi:Ca-activated chloride channel family protein